MKYDKKHARNAKGFYVALGVCLIAVGVAAWTTYDSVVNFTAQDEALSSQEPYQAAEKPVSGVTEPASSVPSLTAESSAAPSEAPESSAAPESEPEPVSQIPVITASEPAQETAAAPDPEPVEETAAPAAQTPDSLGYPIGKSVSLRFSGDEPVYSETMGDWRVHSGADLPGQPGETVQAACEGTVSSVSQDELMGGCVVVTQGDLELYYCGVDEITVAEGETVQAGDAIGVLGEVPCESADGSHLHFGVKRGGVWIDPLELLA